MRPSDREREVVAAWDFDDVAGSEAVFGQRASDPSADAASAAVWRTQVARARGLRGDFAGAQAALDEAEALVSGVEAGVDRDHAEARIAIERGRVLNSSGQAAEALPAFEAAYQAATHAGTAGLAVDALHMRAIAISTVDPEQAARVNEQALDLAMHSPDPAARRWRGSLLNNLGWDLHAAGDHAGALVAFERALTARIEDGATDAQVAIAQWAVARELRSVGRLHEALAMQQRLAAEPASAGDGYVHEEIAECLLELGRVEEAKAEFAAAHQLLSADEWLVEHEPERLSRLAEYAASEDDPGS